MFQEYFDEVQKRLSWKQELRSKNVDSANLNLDEQALHKLDSSLKKNTAFIRKVRNFSTGLLSEAKTLNLTKYIGEVATAIIEVKIKVGDIKPMVELCSFLHQRYGDFSGSLLTAWTRVLAPPKDYNLSKLRVDLRLYSDLVSVGIFTLKEGLSLLGNVLTHLMNNDKEEHNNLSIILLFCRHCGEDFAGLQSQKMAKLGQKWGNKELPKSTLLPEDKQKGVRQLLKDYFESAISHLLKLKKDISKTERKNLQILYSKGDLDQDKKDKLEAMQASFEKLLSNADVLSDLLGLEMPEIALDDVEDKLESDDVIASVCIAQVDEEEIWEDKDVKAFYESLVDLNQSMPKILCSQEPVVEPIEPEEVITEDTDIEEVLKDLEDIEKLVQQQDESIEAEEVNTNQSAKMVFDAYLSNLSNCVNRDMIDQAAAEFCLDLNNKSNRKKLTHFLFSVHRNRQDLIPFYSRLVATLHPIAPDIGRNLSTLLKREFRWLVCKKDQMKIESKLKVCRFIGELVKFKMFEPNEALFCLRMLLRDFTHHHIEMACVLMETCGRYLYHTPATRPVTAKRLEEMMRFKTATNMDTRYIMMIENAYYNINPPEGQSIEHTPKSPLEEYVCKLLYVDLCKSKTERVLKQLRKMHWETPEVAEMIVNCLKSVWEVKYPDIRYIASIVSGLSVYYDWVGVQIVDWVLEDVRMSMEICDPKFNQRRVSVMKFLGELYNYKLLDSNLVVKVLYSLITFSTGFSQENLDLREDVFRIKLVCILLSTCGSYIKSSRRKIDYFLKYFQVRIFFLNVHMI